MIRRPLLWLYNNLDLWLWPCVMFLFLVALIAWRAAPAHMTVDYN